MNIGYLSPWLMFWLALLSESVAGFATHLPLDCRHHPCRRWWSGGSSSSSSSMMTLFSTTTTTGGGGDGVWENLVPEHEPASPVRKTVLRAAVSSDQSPATRPHNGSVVTVEYSGSLWMDDHDDGGGSGNSIPSWDTLAVLDCWLSEQQGLYEILSGPFENYSVDGSMLLDETVFTEAFVADTLGVANKIRCKKTIMAAKRLRSTVRDFEHGRVVDAKPSYEFVIGEGKTIRAMELLVASMEEGETARVVARCDYGYGSDGCRTSKGDDLVPPFCGLRFDVTLLSVK